MQRRVIKLIKRVKDYSYKEILKKFGLTTLLGRRIRGDQIQTLKIMKFLIMADIFFNLFSPNWEFIVKTDFEN